MSAQTPTARSMVRLRADGYIATKVEQRIPIPGGRPVTRDAFGFGDILACHPTKGILLVQATSRPNVSARVTKATAPEIVGASKVAPMTRENPLRLNLLAWLHAGGHFEVWGWYRYKKGRWARRIVRVEISPSGLLRCEDAPDPTKEG